MPATASHAVRGGLMHTDLATTQIAVLGAGLVGAGWAALFVHHGATVRVWDPAFKDTVSVTALVASPQ